MSSADPERFFSPCGKALVMSNDLLFDVDQSVLRPGSRPYLRKVGRLLQTAQGNDLKLRVEGHADPRGDEAHNQDLSRKRAQSIADWLVRSGAIDASRIEAAGLGESQPAVRAPQTSDLQRFNRRVEIRVACPPSGREEQPPSP